MDKIIISDLEVRTIIGTLPKERTARQSLLINLELSGDFSAAGQSDSLEKAVNYRTVETGVIDLMERSDCFLLECAAEKIAAFCLSFDLIQSVRVRIDKKAAALRAKSIAVEVERKKSV